MRERFGCGWASILEAVKRYGLLKRRTGRGFLVVFGCLYGKSEFGIFNSFEGNVSAFWGTVGTLAVRM